MLLSHIYLIGFVGDPSDLARLIPVIKKAEEDEVRREIADSKDKLRELFSKKFEITDAKIMKTRYNKTAIKYLCSMRKI